MRSIITVKQILGDARMIAGAMDHSNPTDASMIAKYNFILNNIYKLLNGARANRFFAHSPLGTPGGLIIAIESDLKTYTASSKKITATTVSSTAVGGLVMFSNSAIPTPPLTVESNFCTYITAVTVNTDFTVAKGPAANIVAGNLSYIVLLPPIVTTHSIDGYRVEQLRRVHFVSTGNAPRKDEDVIESLGNNPNYDNLSVIVFTGVSGNPTVKVKAGSGVTNLGGFPIIFYEEKPYRVTALADLVDLPTEYHAALTEEIARVTLVERGTQIPRALENPLMTLEAMSQAYQSAVQTFASNRDVP